MRFERVDDKTVKCFISNEELDEYQIEYKDFVTRTEKARELMQEIIEKAEETVGYRPPKIAFDMQIMVIPERGLLLTFSESDPLDSKEGNMFMECLKEFRDMMDKMKGSEPGKGDLPLPVGGHKQNGEVLAGIGDGNARSEEQEKNDKKKASKDNNQGADKAIFVFGDIHTVLSFASVLPSNTRFNSCLYRMNDKYYLRLEKGKASYNRFSRACIHALEFCDGFYADEGMFLYLEEHGDCIVAENAVRKLKL